MSADTHTTCRLVYVADMQSGSPKSFRYAPAWTENWRTARSQIIEAKPDFIIVGGDLTRDGSIHKWELSEMQHDLDSMRIPYYTIPGNMDTGNKHADKQGALGDRDDVSLNITSEQLKNWKDVFGDWKWTFTWGNLRVSGFCDMVVNSGLPEEKELEEWFEKQKRLPELEHHIWIMHYPLFIERPDEPDWDIADTEQYLKWYFSIDMPGRKKLLEVFKRTGATRVISGHVHCQHDSVFEGIHFDCAPAVCGTQFLDVWPEGSGKQGFYIYTVNGKSLEREFIPLRKISKRMDEYGPGGHPKPENRDYTIAWEK